MVEPEGAAVSAAEVYGKAKRRRLEGAGRKSNNTEMEDEQFGWNIEL